MNRRISLYSALKRTKYFSLASLVERVRERGCFIKYYVIEKIRPLSSGGGRTVKVMSLAEKPFNADNVRKKILDKKKKYSNHLICTKFNLSGWTRYLFCHPELVSGSYRSNRICFAVVSLSSNYCEIIININFNPP